MNYQELDYEKQHLTEAETQYNYDEDTLEEIYADAEEFVEDDSIADWEEGFMQGYMQA